MPEPRQVIIMRGIPGSGKSSFLVGLKMLWSTAVVVSADHYFMDPDTMAYEFVPANIGKAHEACKLNFDVALAANGGRVIVDNTNTQRWEYQYYLDQAALHGYQIVVLSLKAQSAAEAQQFAERNTHGVPVDKVLAMHERWED